MEFIYDIPSLLIIISIFIYSMSIIMYVNLCMGISKGGVRVYICISDVSQCFSQGPNLQGQGINKDKNGKV